MACLDPTRPAQMGLVSRGGRGEYKMLTLVRDHIRIKVVLAP